MSRTFAFHDHRAAALAACGLASILALSGCGGAPPVPRVARRAEPASPLGPSYVLSPLPGDDDALLGRVLLAPPEAGHSLEETARPNPCEKSLGPAKTFAQASSFEDAEELAVSARASAVLGIYGFSGDVGRATHFLYKVSTERQVARTDTPEYVACCKQSGACGYGYVSALIYGEGEYAAAEETRASGQVDVAVASAGGTAELKILHQRKVRGYLAALVTVTDPSKAPPLGPLGLPETAGVKLDERTIPEAVKARFEETKLWVGEPHAVTRVLGAGWSFQNGDGKITENEFVRRYRALTGSNELDDLDRRRNWGGLITFGVLTGVAVTGVVAGASALRSENSVGTRVAGGFATTFGVIGGLAFGTVFTIKLLDGDGTYGEHYLGQRDAEIYVQAYNRALLRDTVQSVQRRLRGSSLELHLGPGQLSLSGSF